MQTLPLQDQMCGVYWLLCQNRIKEARKLFSCIATKKGMSYDYLQVFLSFFDRDKAKALAFEDLVHKYLKMPMIPSKKKLWIAARSQIQELVDRERTLKLFVKKPTPVKPTVKVNIDNNKKIIKINCSASPEINQLRLNFFDVDLEMLFSNAPFSSVDRAISFIAPTLSMDYEFKSAPEDENKNNNSNSNSYGTAAAEEKKSSDNVLANLSSAATAGGKVQLDLPKEVISSASYVLEVIGLSAMDMFSDTGVCRVTRCQYNNTLFVEFNRARNDMFVGNFSKFPLEGAYVKVYIQTEQHPNGYFLKDGYTDLRGRFDYLETNTRTPNNAQAVSIFVQSDKCGANIYRLPLP
jgi:hypothetical protein